MKKANKPQQIYGTGKAPMAGQTMVVGKKSQKQIDYIAMYEQKAKDYDDQCSINRSLMQEYNTLSSVSVSQSIYDKQVAENKTVAEQLATERKNVELLQQQVHNKDVYINRLNSVIGQLNIQIFKA